MILEIRLARTVVIESPMYLLCLTNPSSFSMHPRLQKLNLNEALKKAIEAEGAAHSTVSKHFKDLQDHNVQVGVYYLKIYVSCAYQASTNKLLDNKVLLTTAQLKTEVIL